LTLLYRFSSIRRRGGRRRRKGGTLANAAISPFRRIYMKKKKRRKERPRREGEKREKKGGALHSVFSSSYYEEKERGRERYRSLKNKASNPIAPFISSYSKVRGKKEGGRRFASSSRISRMRKKETKSRSSHPPEAACTRRRSWQSISSSKRRRKKKRKLFLQPMLPKRGGEGRAHSEVGGILRAGRHSSRSEEGGGEERGGDASYSHRRRLGKSQAPRPKFVQASITITLTGKKKDCVSTTIRCPEEEEKGRAIFFSIHQGERGSTSRFVSARLSHYRRKGVYLTFTTKEKKEKDNLPVQH